MSAPQPGDKSAAFTGLILGAIGLFLLCFAVVRLTNAAHHAETPAAGAPASTAAPAAH
jgi:hypothetical protein